MALERPFPELKEAATAALLNTTRVANQIAQNDLDFHRSVNHSIGPLLEEQSARLLKLARSLTKAATGGTDLANPQLSNAESVDEKWPGLVDVFDSLLEKADACLDEYTGSIKRLDPAFAGRQEHDFSKRDTKSKLKRLDHTSAVKPQLSFEHAVQNRETTAFKPLLQSKPHALISFEESLQPFDEPWLANQ